MLSPSLCFGFCFVVLWRGGKGATEESFYILLSDWRQLKPCMDILQDPWSMKQNFREISLETLDTWDFIGFFFTCDVAGRSRTTCQAPRAVKSPQCSRRHVGEGAIWTFIEFIRCYSMFLYILLSQSVSLWPRRSSDDPIHSLFGSCHCVMSFYIIYHGYHDVLWWIWLNDWMMNYVVLEVVCCSNLQQYAAFYDRSRTQSHTVLTSDTSGWSQMTG